MKKIKKLYLLTQSDRNDYDTYDSCVVVACSPEEAKNISPRGDNYANRNSNEHNQWNNDSRFNSWTNNPNNVKAEEIGTAIEGTENNTVIIASFNAG